MKSFAISLVFLAVTVTAISVNAYFVDGTLSDISALLENMPSADADTESLGDLLPSCELAFSKWNNALPFLSLSIEKELLRDLSVSVGNLYAFCLSDSVPDYNAALFDCRTRLRFLRSRERYSFFNVL